VIKACRIGIGAATDAVLRFQHQAGKPARAECTGRRNAGDTGANYQNFSISIVQIERSPKITDLIVSTATRFKAIRHG
jgi:hypothetical protein